MIRSKIQDRKLVASIKNELDVKLNAFGLKIRRLENDIRSLRRKIIKLEKQGEE